MTNSDFHRSAGSGDEPLASDANEVNGNSTITGVRLGEMPDECPKCGATADDDCRYERDCWLDYTPPKYEAFIDELRQQLASGEDLANEDAKVLLRRYDHFKRKLSNAVCTHKA